MDFADGYYHVDSERSYSLKQLSTLEPELQRDVMEGWFRSNFEDPAEHTPYESAEGGYIWIWGGPYEAEEELRQEFEGAVPESVITELAEELGRECWEWARTQDSLYEREYFDLLATSEPFHSFVTRMGELEALTKVDLTPDVELAQFQLLQSAGVSAFEAYLVERIVGAVREHPTVLKRFIENYPRFREHKVPVADIFKMTEGIEDYAARMLTSMVWHRIPEVKRVLKHAFGLSQFPETGDLERVIAIRHDIVHRAGRTADGEIVAVNPDELKRQFDVVRDFVDEMEDAIATVLDGEEQDPEF